MKNKLLQPPVSILIAKYNNEAFLKRSLNSCLNQQYKNLETAQQISNTYIKPTQNLHRLFSGSLWTSKKKFVILNY